MVTKGKNFSGQVPPSIIDTEYENCNFAQPAPVDTAGVMTGIILFPGDNTPRTFTHCTMTNCEPPPGSTCNRRCTIRRNEVVVDTDTITVDGQSVTLNLYANIVYGHHLDGVYVYFPEPKEYPCDGPEDNG